MKFSRFLIRYERTSTSLIQGLESVSDPDLLSDQSFSHRQAIDKNRHHVQRYTESEIVQDTNLDARRTIVKERRAARQTRQLKRAQDVLDSLGRGATGRRLHPQRGAIPQTQRPMISTTTPKHRFSEPASRLRPM